MRLLAWSDGASWGLSDTLCFSATVSNCGTKTFVTTARPSQKNAISTENRRIVCATRSVLDGRSARCVLIRTCLGSSCRRSGCWPFPYPFDELDVQPAEDLLDGRP